MILTEQKMDVRRAILRLAIGKSTVINTGHSTPGETAEFAHRFAKARGRALAIETEPGRLQITEIEPVKRPAGRPTIPTSDLKYPIGDLVPGDSVLIELPRTEHTKIRNTASAWSQRKGWRLRCNAEGDAIRVTRIG